MVRFGRAAFAVLVLAAAAGQASAAVITNGGFEANPAPNGSYIQAFGGDTTSIPGWTVTGADVLVIDADYIEPGNGVGGGTQTFNANSGQNAVDLTGAGNTSPADGIFQDVATVAGQAYSLSFYVGRAIGGAVYSTPSTVDLQIDGGAVQSFTNALLGADNTIVWQLFTTTFVATDATTTILFSNGTPVGNNYAGLDDVSISAVPEPGTMSLLALGGFGLAGGWYRKRKAALAV